MSNTQQMVKELVEKHGRERTNLMAILQGVVDQQNHLDDQAIIEIAREMDLSAAQVYGTASFYTFLDIKPRGEYVIRLCRTITCDMKGKREILHTLENLLKVNIGETTPDNKFTLLETNCLGWCHKGPAMLINNKAYTELTPEKVKEIITEIKHKS
ncbi:MAG: NAD(P)H-dependent oxidoreductase subunit E [Bacteroidales bacterium]|nr:NAD(P)H-dependent oxidoreductase subunit E [Bacteroidales bacterium]MCF8327425.1 NAD(P)H-dependent oxidoreductase subunit E [Bacteroidales bacterium]